MASRRSYSGSASRKALLARRRLRGCVTASLRRTGSLFGVKTTGSSCSPSGIRLAGLRVIVLGMRNLLGLDAQYRQSALALPAPAERVWLGFAAAVSYRRRPVAQR